MLGDELDVGMQVKYIYVDYCTRILYNSILSSNIRVLATFVHKNLKQYKETMNA